MLFYSPVYNDAYDSLHNANWLPSNTHQPLISCSVDYTVSFKLPYTSVKPFLCIAGQICTIKFTSYFISWCVFILGQGCFSENEINDRELQWENNASENTLCSVSRKVLFGWEHLQHDSNAQWPNGYLLPVAPPLLGWECVTTFNTCMGSVCVCVCVCVCVSVYTQIYVNSVPLYVYVYMSKIMFLFIYCIEK